MPDGWRVDQGACFNEAGGTATTDVCFSVAVANGTPSGAYEILIEIFKEEDGLQAKELSRLWLCVGGHNPFFFAVANDRFPAWECRVNDEAPGAGVTPVAAVVPFREGVDDGTVAPSESPTLTPFTGAPTGSPSAAPTGNPSGAPTSRPTSSPTAIPSTDHTVEAFDPTSSPTTSPDANVNPDSGGKNGGGVASNGVIAIGIVVVALGFGL